MNVECRDTTPGPHAEREFLRFCEVSNLKPCKQTIIEYGRESSEANRFIFLCLKPDDGACVSTDTTSFVDVSTACPGGGAFGTCGRGAKQVGKVSIKPQGIEQITEFGLLSASYPNVPRVLLVSATVGEALSKAGVSGCEISPTDTPNCCQLRITVETAGPARIGHARMGPGVVSRHSTICLPSEKRER